MSSGAAGVTEAHRVVHLQECGEFAAPQGSPQGVPLGDPWSDKPCSRRQKELDEGTEKPQLPGVFSGDGGI